MRQIGKGFSSAYKFCAILNLPALSKSGYKKHEHRLLKVVTDVAEDSMCNAAKEVAETFNLDVCGISVDGTWQRRGHTDIKGCVAVLSIDTGKVLDLEVMSSYCPYKNSYYKKCIRMLNMLL
ncbi:uncharacterized protein CDAR_217871 [Caerostris darwini]|uniref:Mutator-like transposase domain-containing protein n=1 Tax=Caerostris darwini TaxID=1538125 RepID=A0AAV4S9E7_9ARAC|nr:uncharacterized protein CDAR_217871 [Caerostris darwini]